MGELDEKANAGIIDEYTKLSIMDMSKKVLEHLAKKYSNIKKEVGAVMGGKILDYEAKDILNAGKAMHLVEQVQKKLAKNKSIEQIADELEADISTIEEIIAKM